MSNTRSAQLGCLVGLIQVLMLGFVIPVPVSAQETDPMPKTVAAPKRNLLIDAERLLQAQRYDDAYRLLSFFREMRKGEPNFDFLLGRAALHIGHHSEAITLFENIVGQNSGNVAVRIWLAQAYFVSGDKGRANKEYLDLDSIYLPADLSQFVKQQLRALEQGVDTQTPAFSKPMWSGYLEAIGGYDSNINNATNAEFIYIPALGDVPFQLSSQVRQHETAYYGLGGGLQTVVPMSSNIGIYARGDIRCQNNENEKDYNSYQGSLGTGFILLSGNHMARLGFNGSIIEYRGVGNNDTIGADIEYTYSINSKDQLIGFLGYSQYRYERDFQINDMNRVIGGFAYKHAFDFYKSNISIGLIAGQEDDVAPRTLANPSGGRVDGKQDFYGIFLSGRVFPRGNIELFATVSWQHGLYEKKNIIFLKNREDDRVSVALGAVVNITSSWSLRPQFVYAKSETNIPINQYERNAFSVTLRKDFQ